jgi:hypothetical protein
MIIGGVWYERVVNHWRTNILYRLFTNFGPTFIYSHMVITSKFPMFPCATRLVQDSLWFLKWGRISQ